MNKWLQSFLLHPFFNRFNGIFFAGWIGAGLFTELPHVFLTGFAIEVAYLVFRGMLDRTGRPLFMLRRLPTPAKKRFLAVADMAHTIEQDFERIAPDSKLLDRSADQAKRMAGTFLNLLISEYRIETYLKSIREDFNAKISELTIQAQSASGEMKELIERNIEIYRKRQEKFGELQQKQVVIRGRLDTIENTLNLLSDTAASLGKPGEVSQHLDLLMTNVADAEIVIDQVQQMVPDNLRQRVR
jgi:hypothetical protein